MKIINYPNPVLLRRADPIEEVDDEIREKVEQMIVLMHEAKGVGLAAPQVGWSARLFVTNPSGDPGDDHVFINPSIQRKGKKERGEEGCLSLPQIYIQVERAKHVDVTYTDLEGKPCVENHSDFAARVIQHEFDHLEGILLVHKMSPTDRIQFKDVLRELEATTQ